MSSIFMASMRGIVLSETPQVAQLYHCLLEDIQCDLVQEYLAVAQTSESNLPVSCLSSAPLASLRADDCVPGNVWQCRLRASSYALRERVPAGSAALHRRPAALLLLVSLRGQRKRHQQQQQRAANQRGSCCPLLCARSASLSASVCAD